MSKIKISIDSACDCDKATLEKNNVAVIPFSVLIDGVDKLDGVEVSGKDVVDYVVKTDVLPRTSAPSMEAYENLQFESEVYCKLKEAEREAEINSTRYSSKDVLKALKKAAGEVDDV